jgi:tRNA-binding protein
MDKLEKEINWKEFQKVEMRVGTILSAQIFKEANNPSYKMIIDFGDFGQRKTSAQITALYKPADLIDQQIIAVVNFPPKQIANTMSECLILGAVGDQKEVTLITAERKVKNGTKIA